MPLEFSKEHFNCKFWTSNLISSGFDIVNLTVIGSKNKNVSMVRFKPPT